MLKVIIAASIMIYFTLLIILVLNFEQKSKIIKNSFLILMIVLLISFFLTNELVMDYLISFLIRFWYFPTFASLILVIFVTIMLFAYSVFKEKISKRKRIVDYCFACFIIIGYIIFMLLNININSYNSLYNGHSLICIRYISRSFTLWMIIKLIFNYGSYLGRKR